MQLSKRSIEISSSGPRSRTQMSWFRAMRPAIGPVRISEPPRRARTSPVRAVGAAREWGPRELNPAGLSGRRVYSAPRLPYRSRAPLLCLRCRAAEKQKSHRVRPGGSFALLRSIDRVTRVEPSLRDRCHPGARTGAGCTTRQRADRNRGGNSQTGPSRPAASVLRYFRGGS